MSANKKSKKYGIWSWVVALYGPIIFWTLLINLPKVEWKYVFESNKARVARHHQKAKEMGLPGIPYLRNSGTGSILYVNKDEVAYAAMRSGRLDAYASTLVSLLAFAQTSDDVTVIPFTSNMWKAEYTAMAFRKEDESFRSAINQIIVDMKNDGTLASLQQKWFGQSFVDLLPNEAPTW